MEKNDTLMFHHQIKVEEASKGMLDLPPELIEEIDQYLPFADKKKFREVCLACPLLKHAYNDKIVESAVMKVNLDELGLCEKFVYDFNILVDSNMKISLVLPPKYVLDKLPTEKSQELKSKLIQFVTMCEERIVHILVDNRYGDKDASYRVPRDIKEEVLPKLTNLKKIEINTREDEDDIVLGPLHATKILR